MSKYDFQPSDFLVGQRAQVHPATDAWMQGDRFGTVTKIGARLVQLRMERSGAVRRFPARDILEDATPGRWT